MKRILIAAIASLGLTSAASAAVLVQESFNYPAGALTAQSAGAWTAQSGAGSSAVLVLATPSDSGNSLSVAGLAGVAGGRVASIWGSGTREDVGDDFTTQTAGTVYYSAVIKVTTATTAGDYIMHMGSGGLSTNFRGRFFVRGTTGTATNSYQLGLQYGSNGVRYDVANEYPCGTSRLIVVGININSGTNNDSADLFVSPTLGQSTPPTATIANVVDAASADADLGRVGVRQGSSGSGTVEIDEIRVGTAWTDVTPSNAGIEQALKY